MFLHPPGHFPDLGRVVLAPPGTETIIQLSQVQRARATWPYSNCEQDKSYQYQKCMDLCIQKASVDHCQCLDYTIPTSPEARNTTKFCGLLDTDDVTKLTETLKCRRDYGAPIEYEKCNDQCPPECNMVIYNHRQMSAPWPHHSRHLAFHRDLVMDKPYSHKFKLYTHIRNVSATNQTEGGRRLQEAHLIGDNFLKVRFSHDTNCKSGSSHLSYPSGLYIGGMHEAAPGLDFTHRQWVADAGYLWGAKYYLPYFMNKSDFCLQNSILSTEFNL